MAIKWQADCDTADTAWTNSLSVSSTFVKPLQQLPFFEVG
jgi:hypothetical protein